MLRDPQVHFFKDFDSEEKFRITGRDENSMLPSHFQVRLPALQMTCRAALDCVYRLGTCRSCWQAGGFTS